MRLLGNQSYMWIFDMGVGNACVIQGYIVSPFLESPPLKMVEAKLGYMFNAVKYM